MGPRLLAGVSCCDSKPGQAALCFIYVLSEMLSAVALQSEVKLGAVALHLQNYELT